MLSKKNVKLIQSLKHKKHRIKHKLFVAEGLKLILDLLPANLTVKNIFITSQEIIEQNKLLQKYAEKTIVIDEKGMKSISGLQTPTNILILAEIPEITEADISENGLFLLLDEIQDPGNFGTILRYADWFGVKGIVCSEDCADLFNPKVIQSSMGSFYRTPLTYTDLNAFLVASGKQNVYAADMEGINLFETDFPEQTFILLGNEGKGLKPGLKQHTTKITIPAFGKAESLNVAIAGSIISAFWRKQHPEI